MTEERGKIDQNIAQSMQNRALSTFIFLFFNDGEFLEGPYSFTSSFAYALLTFSKASSTVEAVANKTPTLL